MIGAVVGWVLLWGVYLAVLGDVHAADLGVGAAVAAAVLAGCRPFLSGTRSSGAGRRAARVHLLGVPGLVAATLVEIVRGAVAVLGVVFTRSPRAQPGIVEVPFPEASAAALTTLALTLTLSPGSVIVDLDRRRRIMRVHVIDARDPEGVVAHIVEFDRRWRQPAVE